MTRARRHEAIDLRSAYFNQIQDDLSSYLNFVKSFLTLPNPKFYDGYGPGSCPSFDAHR